jgi:uncharacterized protein (TIGR03437 family)
MERKKFLYGAKCAAVLTAVPFLLWAYSTGPDPEHTGAPGEQTCAQSGCHIGTALNSSNGKVEVTYSGGSTYTPGERGKFTVTITDTGTPARRVYGFQASARILSSNAQAGAFVAGAGQLILCGTASRTASCTSPTDVQFISHSTPGDTNTFSFDWNPPATASGDIRVYVAANAANGNGTESGDRIYSTSLTLSPGAVSGGPKPAVTSGGVVNTWSNSTTVATNTWIAIYGSDLSSTTKDWSSAPDFAQGKLPLSLDGVSVTIGGKPAPVYFISPGQVNALVPEDTASGNLPLVVKNANGESAAVTVVRQELSPALLTVPVDGKLKVVGRLNSNPNLVLGITGSGARPFSPGDVVQFYATGLGPTNPSIPVANLVTGAPALTNAPAIRINNVPVQVVGSALVGSGLYQVNGIVPEVPDGDQPVTIEVGGVTSPTGIVIAVQKQ